MLLEQVPAKWEEKAPKAMQILEEGFEGATAVLDYPNRYRRRLCTTNGVETGERVIRIFPGNRCIASLAPC
ncbi:transposase [Geobacillus thermodenitrificans]|uniref:transposase n=1 Tax=Geobacillus thermodenitrificans TaxID=33940 RepID=UPI0004153FBD|nr:transposase [Geobacillus thermodenitrificans]